MADLNDYYPPTSQPYQHRILVFEANSLIGHRLIEYFRNDHLIEVNPNVILGTIDSTLKYSNELGLDIVIETDNQPLLASAVASADFILFPLTLHNTRTLEFLLKLLKNLNTTHNIKLILLSHISAAKTPLLARQTEYLTRSPLQSAVLQLQHLCLALNTFNPNIQGCVLSSGLVYGMGEEALFPLFKQALEQKEPLKIYGRGLNHIPMIHVDDLAQMVYDIAFSARTGFHFASDYSTNTQRDIIIAISQTIGNGKIVELPLQDSFLDPNFDILTSDIKIEANSLPKLSTWKYAQGLVANLGSVVGEFNSSRGLKPNKILIHGAPVAGKSKLADILSKNYGLPVLTTKGLIEEIKAQDTPFANQIKGILEELKAVKIEEERKVYEQAKKKKKGKGMEDFDPSKIVVRLGEKDVIRVLKRRISMADCLNKGYIIDGMLKTYSQLQLTFLDEQGEIIPSLLPNSIFNIQASEDEVKDRVKKLPAQVVEGTHWNQEHTVRRFNAFRQQNDSKKWFSFFQGKVDVKLVPLNYSDPNELIAFIERNGPLGFKVKPAKVQKPVEQKQEVVQESQKEVQEQKEQEEQDQEEFNIQKLTQSETKILNEKSRPIRQYLIDNVIPQITQGLLQICKDTPPDPIKYLINFLQSKRNKKKKGSFRG